MVRGRKQARKNIGLSSKTMLGVRGDQVVAGKNPRCRMDESSDSLPGALTERADERVDVQVMTAENRLAVLFRIFFLLLKV